MSTDEIDGETDWFDLGISISIEGRQIPFARCSPRSPATSRTCGAYFSLRKPELQSLRKLIEEARSLADTPDGPLRISRFQADLWDELTELGVIDRRATAWKPQVTGLLSLASAPAPELPATPPPAPAAEHE